MYRVTKKYRMIVSFFSTLPLDSPLLCAIFTPTVQADIAILALMETAMSNREIMERFKGMTAAIMRGVVCPDVAPRAVAVTMKSPMFIVVSRGCDGKKGSIASTAGY